MVKKKVVMNIYIDTEFLEGTQKKWFGRETKHTIDLISLGICREDGISNLWISNEFNLKEAWNRCEEFSSTDREYWIRENVLRPLFENMKGMYRYGYHLEFDYKTLKFLIGHYGKTNKQIAQEVRKFVGVSPKFYGYYSDYDWVVFCWLFGKMVNLPDDFPMYCIDLKQTFDEVVEDIRNKHRPDGGKNTVIESLKRNPHYPVNLKEHDAQFDAIWTKDFHAFLIEIKRRYEI